MKKHLLFLLATLLVATASYSQVKCGFDEAKNTEILRNQNYRFNSEEVDAKIKTYIEARGLDRSVNDTFYIPVVVHVMHSGGALGAYDNPTNATIISTIDYLNKVYNGTWNGAGGGIIGVGDINIKFVLATKDTNNIATSGIDRFDCSSITNYSSFGMKLSSANGVDELTIKNISRWDPYKYYNIWVVNKIDGCGGVPNTCPSYTAGFAYFPHVPVGSASVAGAVSRDKDGTIMLATGMIPGNALLPHEIGHAFSLYHPFEGADAATNACPSTDPALGDKCADTDPINNPQGAGNTYPGYARDSFPYTSPFTNACSGTPFVSNTEKNIMNYTFKTRLFTANQKERMKATCMTTIREGLSTSWTNNRGVYPTTWVAPVAASATPVTSATGLSGIYAGIYRVELNDMIVNSLVTSQEGGYVNRANRWYDLFQVQAGTSYTMNVNLLNGGNANQLGVFIDYNNDGIFNSTTERIYINTNVSSAAASGYTLQVPITFTVPASTAMSTGSIVRMRVINDLSTIFGLPAVSGTSTSVTYGQAEDYPIYLAAEPCTAPAAPTASGVSICSGNTASLSATGAGTLKWYSASTGGTLLATASTYTTPALTTNTTYYVQDSTCAISATRTAVLVTVNALPALSANSGGSATVCVNANTPAFTNTQSGGTWSIVTGTGTASVSTGGVVTGLTAGTVSVKYTYSNGTCSNSVSSSVTVNALPILSANSAGAASVCVGLTTPAFTNAQSGGTWSIVAGTGTASISTGGVVTGLTAGTVSVKYTYSNGTCSNSVSSSVTVNALPILSANSGGAASVCVGSTTPAFTNAQSGGTWSIVAGTGTASISTGGVVTGLTAGTVSIKYTYSNGTCSNSVSSALAVTTSSRDTTIATSCGMYIWSANGSDYISSGTYSYTEGCATHVLVLTVNEPTSDTTIETSCGMYVWENGNLSDYFTSGTYSYTENCVTHVLILTVNQPTYDTTVATSCGMYIWETGNFSDYFTTGIYSYTEDCITHVLDLTVSQAPPTDLNLSGPISICTGNSVTLLLNDSAYAASVIKVSSEYAPCPDNWSSCQLLGAPDTYPMYGDIATSWSSITSGREFLELGFNYTSPINYIDIYETYFPGLVDTVYVKNPNTGLFEVVYSGTASVVSNSQSRIMHISFPTTSFNVSEIRIAININGLTDFYEIDAVKIGLKNEAIGYVWSPGGQTTSSINVTSAGTYSVTADYGNGCTSTSEQLVVTLNDLQSPTIVASGSTSICQGSSVELTAVAPNNSGGNFATSVIKVSSEYAPCPDNWSSCQLLGAPDTYPMYGDIATSWSSITSGREFLELGFNNTSPINYIDIYETYFPGLVDTVYVKNPNTGLFEVVYSGTASVVSNSQSRIMHISFPTTSFNVSEIRIAININGLTDFYEIDAVKIGLENEAFGYLWSPGGQTTSSINVTSAGSYSVAISNGSGCSATSQPMTISYETPNVAILGDTSICAGVSTTLNVVIQAPPLDVVANSTLAIGLRKLKSAYNGSALRLRRSTDNQEQDFGFDGNDLDVNAISAWLNGADGFCTTLYDQSGNGGNVIQSDTAAQPLFVASGINNKPILHFTTTQHMFNGVNYPAPYSVIYGSRVTGVSERMLSSVYNNWLLGYWGSYEDVGFFGNDWLSNPASPVVTNQYNIYASTGTGSISTIYKNGVELVSNANSLQGPYGIRLNGWTPNQNEENSDGDFTDVMVFGTALSSQNIALLNKSINSYYTLSSTGTNATSYLWSTGANTASISVNTPGEYSVTTTINGCSSTATVNVTTNEPTSDTTVATSCGMYIWESGNLSDYMSSGTYSYTEGCVTHVLILTVNEAVSDTLTVTETGYYTWQLNGNDYYSSGTYTSTTGCLTHVLILTIVPNAADTTFATTCGMYVWPINGSDYFSSGTYYYSSGTLNYVLVLTINQPTQEYTYDFTCGMYVWPINGSDYFESGTYTYTQDCIEYILVLTIGEPTYDTTVATGCEYYFWPRNSTFYYSTGVYNYTEGCFSYVLDLTMNQPTSDTTVATSCGMYIWETGNFSDYFETGTYSYTENCVTHVLELTVNEPTTDTTRASICSGGMYIWDVNGSDYFSSGTYTYDDVENCINHILILTVSQPVVIPTPTSITQTLLSNVCGARKYRYSTAAVLNATGYNWNVPTSVGGVSGMTVDSGDVNSSRIIVVTYASNAAAATTDSVKVRAFSACGISAYKAAKLTNTALKVPSAPTAITITPLITNVCGLRVYRYSAPSLPVATTTTTAATSYLWFLEGALGANATIDSGDINGRTIVVRYTSNAASAAGDTIRVIYLSDCGASLSKATKLTNTALSVPAVPTAITITPLITNVCGLRVYRYSAPALPGATATAGAATGYAWSFTGTLGSNAQVDSGTLSSRTIIVRYNSNGAAGAGDSVKVLYTSDCGNGAAKAAKLTNVVIVAPAAPTAITITAIQTNVCGERKYRYSAPNLPVGTATATAATGYVWDFVGSLAEFATIDSGDENSQKLILIFSSNAAASAGDSIRVQYTSSCGNSLRKAAKFSNLKLSAQAAPAALTITAIQTNVCGARRYRYSAPALPAASTTAGAATGYVWSFVGSLASTMTVDSGSLTSRILTVTFTSNTAALAGDSVRVFYTSDCGNSLRKTAKLSNTAIVAPAAPTSITIALKEDVCNARKYRYIAPATLPGATAIAGAASGYLWSLPTGTVGSTGTLDSGSLGDRIIVVSYTSNAAAGAGDSIRVRYTSGCGNGAIKAQKLSNLLKAGCPPPTITKAPVTQAPKGSMSVKVYPNPSTSQFNVQVNTTGSEEAVVRILDVQGRFVKSVKVAANQVIGLGAELKAGAYLLEVRQGNEVKTTRVIKF